LVHLSMTQWLRVSQQPWYSILKKTETNSDSIDETIIKKPTPIELELKYIEKTLVSQTRKEHCKSLIFLPHLSNLPYEYF
jgi:hypothetical protein